MKALPFLLILLIMSVGCQSPSESGQPIERRAPSEERTEGPSDAEGDRESGGDRPMTGTPAEPEEVQPESLGEPLTRSPSIGVIFRQVSSGLGAFDGTVEMAGQAVSLRVVRADPAQLRVHIVSPRELKAQGRYLAEFLKIHGGQAAISGGFLKSFYPPVAVGYVRVDGRPLNRPVATDLLNGLLVIREGRARILRFPEGSVDRAGRIEGDERWEDALQSGPVLLLDGESALPSQFSGADARELSGGSFRRAFVAIDSAGRTLFALTSEISLPDLVAFLASPQGQRNFGVESALNLSGHETAQLLCPAAWGVDRKLDVALPNAIILQ